MLSSSCATFATDLATPAPGGSRRSRGRWIASAPSWRPSVIGVGSRHRSGGRRSGSTGPTLSDAPDRGAPDVVARPRASRAAYAVRWLELGDGIRRPAWSEFVADPA